MSVMKVSSQQRKLREEIFAIFSPEIVKFEFHKSRKYYTKMYY